MRDGLQQPDRALVGAGAGALRSGRRRLRPVGRRSVARGAHLHLDPLAVDADGGDTPAWTRKRASSTRRRSSIRPTAVVPYAELHCHTNFSFLDGASHPEELAEEAARLGLTALAVTDHDGFYGVVRFSEAAASWACRRSSAPSCPSACPAPQNGEPDPAGAHLLVLARGPRGVRPAGRVIAEAQLRRRGEGPPGLRPGGGRRRAARPCAGAHRLPQGHGAAGAAHRRGGRRGPGAGPAHRAVRRGARGGGADRPRRPVSTATATTRWPRWPPRPGCRRWPPTTCTTPRPGRRRLATALAAVRARRSLDEIDGWLPAGGHRPPAQRGGDGAAVRRATRARWRSAADVRRRAGLRPATGRAAAARLPGAGRGTPR